VVEAHGQDGCQQELLYRLRNTHSVEYFPGPTQATGGVIICIKLHILAVCGPPSHTIIDPGRIICIHFHSRDKHLGIVGVHLVPEYSFQQKYSFIQRIADIIRASKQTLWWVGGDFNFEASGEKSFNLDRNSFTDSSASERLASAWNLHLSHLLEHHQPDFTRVQNGPQGISASRLDRIYSNLPSWRLLSCNVHTSTVGNIMDSNRLSDHIPVMTSIHSSADRPMIHFILAHLKRRWNR